jgi:Ca2+-binding EF-hand superfamily protein
MSKQAAKGPAGKPGASQPKAPEKKVWKAEDYATLTIPVEEVRDIKTAFDIFDGDLSGVVDPQELKRAFEQLGFGGQNKFVYQILAELDDDQSGGIDFAEFLRLATAKLSDKDSRAEVDKVWTSFDINKAVRFLLIQGKITTHELKKVAKDLGEDLNDEEIEKIFVKADLDDDGFVTADDFYNILTHKVYWEQ